MELPQNAAPSACSSLVFRGLTQHLSSPCAVCHLADIPASAPSFASTRTHHTPCCRCSPPTKGAAALLFGAPDRTSLSGGDPSPLLCHISCVAVPPFMAHISLTAHVQLIGLRSNLSIGHDTIRWTTRSTIFKFARTIGSWITDDWELVERVLDVHPIKNKEHEDEYAGAVMARRRSELGVLEKMSSNTFTYRNVDYTIIISITSLHVCLVAPRRTTFLYAR
ncbi:hypothetical protein B0H14DRAFT_3480674 [Mycena olivaceomarginata]|nr:hypothetical protein B0H14DRAFT_3480674 [Mycena olivaceomarginata]